MARKLKSSEEALEIFLSSDGGRDCRACGIERNRKYLLKKKCGKEIEEI